jgi:hypothetical protein
MSGDNDGKARSKIAPWAYVLDVNDIDLSALLSQWPR